jgi:hypothetical protein
VNKKPAAGQPRVFVEISWLSSTSPGGTVADYDDDRYDCDLHDETHYSGGS